MACDVAQVSMVQRTVFGEHCDAVSSRDCELDGSSTLLLARAIWLIASATEEFGTSATASTFSWSNQCRTIVAPTSGFCR